MGKTAFLASVGIPGYCRALRQPPYDTEWVLPNIERVQLFTRPMGQIDATGREKGEADTNMVCPAQLPTPMMFDFCSWRTEFSPNVPLLQILNFRFVSRLNFSYGKNIWFSMPLSYVPFTAYLAAEKTLEIASVLLNPDAPGFAEAWSKAQVVGPGEEPEGAELLKDPRTIYKTEAARNLMKPDNGAYRIKSGETFHVEILTPDKVSSPLPLPADNFAVRLYLEGFAYKGI